MMWFKKLIQKKISIDVYGRSYNHKKITDKDTETNKIYEYKNTKTVYSCFYNLAQFTQNFQKA
jgi:hypothetical protein